MIKPHIDYYQQNLQFLDLIKNEGGYIESAFDLKNRAYDYLKDCREDLFLLECRKAIIQLKGIDEVARVYNLARIDLDHQK